MIHSAVVHGLYDYNNTPPLQREYTNITNVGILQWRTKIFSMGGITLKKLYTHIGIHKYENIF